MEMVDTAETNIAQIFQAALERHKAGALSEAAALYTEVILNQPEHLGALVNIGGVLIDLGRPAEALRYLNYAVRLEPEDAEALNNLGNALQKTGAPEAALHHFEQAHRIAPDNAAILSNLARALIRNGDYIKGLEIFDLAQATEPENEALKVIDALALPMIPSSLEQLNQARARFEQKLSELEEADIKLKDPASEIGATNFALSYHGGNDRRLQERLAAFYLKACPELSYTAPHIQKTHPSDRIKIGFISAHLGSHTIGKLNRALLTGLDRAKFETYVFCPGSDKRGQDDLLDEIAGSVDHFYSPAPLLADTRNAVAAAELDILTYLDIGMEPLTYFLAFSRLAKVQCVMVGHPVTTGIPTVDYFISSALIESDNAAAHYSEKLIQLESFFADYAAPEIPEHQKTRRDFGLNEDAHLYLCPQSLFKFHPDFDAILAGILAGDPQAEIVLLGGPQPNWADLLAARFSNTLGPDSQRVTFLARQSGGDFLALLSLAEVILDTPHFSGGNSSYEAFALGKVIVTLPGEFMRSRVTAGLYQLMGLEDLVSHSPQDYIDRALEIGLNEATRLQFEARIGAAHNRVFNTNSALRTQETFFLEAFENADQ